MPPNGRPSPARLLAPVALVLFALALVVVIFTSNAGEDDRSGERGAEEERTAPPRTATSGTEDRSTRATYTVETGDTLGAIAEQTGVSVERLLELNPELDPQALVSGQKIKLRE